jgi:hypothetical protein
LWRTDLIYAVFSRKKVTFNKPIIRNDAHFPGMNFVGECSADYLRKASSPEWRKPVAKTVEGELFFVRDTLLPR